MRIAVVNAIEQLLQTRVTCPWQENISAFADDQLAVIEQMVIGGLEYLHGITADGVESQASGGIRVIEIESIRRLNVDVFNLRPGIVPVDVVTPVAARIPRSFVKFEERGSHKEALAGTRGVTLDFDVIGERNWLHKIGGIAQFDLSYFRARQSILYVSPELLLAIGHGSVRILPAPGLGRMSG